MGVITFTTTTYNRRKPIYINPAHDKVTLNKETEIIDDEGIVIGYSYESVSFPHKPEYDAPAQYLDDGTKIKDSYLIEHFDDLFEANK